MNYYQFKKTTFAAQTNINFKMDEGPASILFDNLM